MFDIINFDVFGWYVVFALAGLILIVIVPKVRKQVIEI